MAQTTSTRRSFLWRLVLVPGAAVLAACQGHTLDEILPGAKPDSRNLSP